MIKWILNQGKKAYVKTYLSDEATGNHTNGEVACSYTIKSSVAAVEGTNGSAPLFQLEQNYPNPFYSGTVIKYKIQAAGNVQVTVSDMMGRETETLINQYQQPGTYTVSFSPEKLASAGGIYNCRMVAGHYSKTIKMVYIK